MVFIEKMHYLNPTRLSAGGGLYLESHEASGNPFAPEDDTLLLPHNESDPHNTSFEMEKPCTPAVALEEEEKKQRQQARPPRESASAMMIDAPPFGCSLDSIICCARREKRAEFPGEMPESEGPPGEQSDFAGFSGPLPTFALEDERSPFFPSFCEPHHFPAEAMYLYQNSASDVSSSFGWGSSRSGFCSNEGVPMGSSSQMSAHAADEAVGSSSAAMALEMIGPEHVVAPAERRKRKWRKYEDEALMSIVSYTSQGNGEALRDESFWDQVSAKINEALNTNRGPRSCLKRYHNCLLYTSPSPRDS